MSTFFALENLKLCSAWIKKSRTTMYQSNYPWLISVITHWISSEILPWASRASHVGVSGENWYGRRIDAARSSSSLRPFHSHRSSASTMINLTRRTHVSPRREEAKLPMGAERVSTSHSRPSRSHPVHNFESPLSSIRRSRLNVRYRSLRASCTIDVWWMSRMTYICLHPLIEY